VPLFEDLERVKLRFISACETMVNQGKLTEEEFQEILQLLDQLDEYSDDEFMEELRRLSRGMIDFLDWDTNE
jgi:spore coat protein CotH